MVNPYEPIDSESLVEPSALKTAERVTYRGGWLSLAFVGAITGVVAISAAWFLNNPWVVFGVVWFAGLFGAMGLLKARTFSGPARAFTALCTMPIAYVLYIPTCSFSAMVLEGNDYNVSTTNAVVASVVCATLILLLICAVVRRVVQGRMNRRTGL